MAARSGGRYEMRSGKAVLVERTGYKPESEAAPVKKDTDTAPKGATTKGKGDE